MKRTDSFISIYPLFRVKDGQMAAIKKITDEIISRGHGEEGTLLFTAAFSDTHLFLRESYVTTKLFMFISILSKIFWMNSSRCLI